MILRNLSGALDLILGRESGLQKLDLSADGFWRSFIGLALAGAIDAFAIYSTYPWRATLDKSLSKSPFALVSLSLLVALLAYAGAMVALYFMCRMPDTRRRFPNAVVANNWAAPLVSVGFLPVAIGTLALRIAAHPDQPGLIVFAILIVAIGFLVAIGIRLLKVSLDIPQSQAVVLFIGSTAVSWVLESWLSNSFGV